MKKSFILISIFLFIFAFSCTFNLFEGDVESNYKSIKTPSEKIEYARQILASGDEDKISKVLELIKADLNAVPSIFTGDDLIAANQIVGNLLISQSGFGDVVSNIISTMASSSSGSENPDLLQTMVDTDGNGNISETEIQTILNMATDLAAAADYINAAAEADVLAHNNDPDNHPINLDLQFQNVIANLAAAITKVSNLNEQEITDITNYLDGTTSTPPASWDEISSYIYNASDSVENLLTYSTPDSFYYGIAQALQSLFQGVLN